MQRYFQNLKLLSPSKPTENPHKQNDLALGAKVNLLDAEKTAIGFMSSAIIPTGSKALSHDKWGVSSILAISHTLNEKTELAYNLGYEYLGNGNANLS